MLKTQHWTQHSLYQKNLISSLKKFLPSYRDKIEEYSKLIDKLFRKIESLLSSVALTLTMSQVSAPSTTS
jgi:hypothetical protein